MTSDGILITAGTVVGMLVQGAFDGLAHLTRGRHLSAAELAREVAAVDEPLVLPPRELLAGLTADPVAGDPPGRCDLVVPLWTEDGPAGRGVALRLAPTPEDTFDVEILGFPEVAAPSLPSADAAPRRPAAAPPSPPSTGAPVPPRWRPVLAAVVHRLVVGDVDGLVRDGIVDAPGPDGGIARWIDAYPGALVDLPPEAWAYSDHGPVEGRAGTWWVVVDLWTAEEGHSDLGLEATVVDDGREVTVEVTAVHVL